MREITLSIQGQKRRERRRHGLDGRGMSISRYSPPSSLLWHQRLLNGCRRVDGSVIAGLIMVAGIFAGDRDRRGDHWRAGAPPRQGTRHSRAGREKRIRRRGCSIRRSLGVAVEAGRSLGWERISCLVALLGFAMQWARERRDKSEKKPALDRREYVAGARHRLRAPIGLSACICWTNAPWPKRNLLVAQEGDEGDIQALPVQIAGKIEQENLEQDRAVVEHRAPAETRHAVVAAAAGRDAHRIDAVTQPAIGIELEVRGSGSRVRGRVCRRGSPRRETNHG